LLRLLLRRLLLSLLLSLLLRLRKGRLPLLRKRWLPYQPASVRRGSIDEHARRGPLRRRRD
jgi:hypothetical protein